MSHISARVVTQLPAHKSLSNYEPFAAGPTHGSTHGSTQGSTQGFGLRTLEHLDNVAFAKLQNTCRQLISDGVTVGFSTVSVVKAVFFDMDATVIREESLVELSAYAGVQEQVHQITERAMAGELDFKAALRERVALLRGLDASAIDNLAAKLTLMPGIKELVASCRARGVPTFMVSGGFVELAGVISAAVGFDGFHANSFGIEHGRLTGEVVGSVVDATGKQEFMLATCKRLGLSPSEVAAVGDGANDLPMLSSVGTAVGHQPKGILWPLLHAANWSGDHRFLVPLLLG